MHLKNILKTALKSFIQQCKHYITKNTLYYAFKVEIKSKSFKKITSTIFKRKHDV